MGSKFSVKIIFNRSISLLVALTFIISNIAFAEPLKTDTATTAKPEVVTDPAKIVIPRDYGLVKTKYTGKDKRLVIHIQDAHCNYEAQSNIAKILEALIKNDGLSLVSVEGADGFIDTSWFKAFPDAEIRKEVADYFMKKGEITGPEFLSITTDYPIKLFGAETREYYIENLTAFTSSYPLKEDTEKYFNNIKAILNKIKVTVYNDELKALDAKMQDYESKKLQFSDYVRYLESLAVNHKINLRQYENIFKLISVFVYEKKIDFNIVDKERSSLIDELTKKLTKEALTELVTKSLSFKTGKIASVEYYDYLRKLASYHGFDLTKDYPNLFNYIIYNSVYSRIENEKLFKDIRDLELAIKEKLFENDDQRTIDKLSRHIDTLLGLANIKLLNDDFDYYKTHKEEFSHEVFSDFIKKMAAKYGFAFELDIPSDAVKENMPKLEDFYSIAIKRDKALVDNTLNAMNKEKVRICVLVTGGFHSEGMTKLLEKQGISYMVVCPSITKDVPTPYIQILTNQRTSFEDILVGAGTGKSTEVKQGMLAPYVLAAARKLTKKELKGINRKVGLIKKRGLEDRVEEVEPAYMQLAVKGWIKKAEHTADKKGLPKDKDTLFRAYTIAVDAAVVKGGINREDRDLVIRMARSAFDRYFRNTPGTGAIGIPLGLDEAAQFDEVIRESFAAGKANIVEVPEVSGFQFVVHDGLMAALQAKGYPFFLNIHPGRGGETFNHGLFQAHIDKDIYDNLTPAERLTVARHEMAHIQIANFEDMTPEGRKIVGRENPKGYDIWNRWESAGKPTGEAMEALINNIEGCNVFYVEEKINGLKRDLSKGKDISKDSNMTIEQNVAAAAEVLNIEETAVAAALSESINKTMLKNDFAESVGIKADTALQNMVTVGMVAESTPPDYALAKDFYTTAKLTPFVAIQVRSSSNPDMVDLTPLRLERIILNSVDTAKFIEKLAQLSKRTPEQVVALLKQEGIFPGISATQNIVNAARAGMAGQQAQLKVSDIVSPKAADFYKLNGVDVEFNLPAGTKVSREMLEALKEYNAVMARDMARGGYNYRGTGTKQTVKEFFNNYFMEEWYERIRGFVETNFTAKNEPLKAIITNGIGANDQFMWSLVQMYNENKSAVAPTWYHVTTAREFAELSLKLGEESITGKNVLFIDISRSGGTWEGVEVGIRSLQQGYYKRIALANGGAVKAIAEKAASPELGNYEPLVIGMSPDIGGRNMHRKTTIYYTAQTVAGIFLPAMDSKNFAALNDKFDKANGFETPDQSLAVGAGQFLFGSMRLMDVDHIAFVTNTEPLRLIGTEWEQYIMEGSNKEDIISMGIHDISATGEDKEVLANLANSPAGKTSIAMVLLDESAATYPEDLARVNAVKEKMPVMIFTINSKKAEAEEGGLKGGISPNQQAAFDVLWTDLVTVFTTLLRVDANSNPNVKLVREYTAARVAKWKEAEESYKTDLIGKGKAEVVVSLGNPGTAESSKIGGEKQVALTLDNAAIKGAEFARRLAREGMLQGRNRLNLFAGNENLMGLVTGMRNDAYKSRLGKVAGWITNKALFPIWSHKGLEANLGYSANLERLLLANITVNIFLNARRLGENNAAFNQKFDNMGIMPDKYDAINGATVHQTNDAMTMPNIQRMAEVSPTILFEFNNTTPEIEEMIQKFYRAFIEQLAEEEAALSAPKTPVSTPAATAEKSPLLTFNQIGEQIWLDGLTLDMLKPGGEFEELVRVHGITGVTTNPSLIKEYMKSEGVKAKVRKLAKEGLNAEEVCFEIVRDLAETTIGIFKKYGVKGKFSVELNPEMANDKEVSLREAGRWIAIEPEYMMVKVPATEAGYEVTEELIANGLNVNATLVITPEQYEKVAEAYIKGLEGALEAGRPLGSIYSVASFFVSRWDVAVKDQMPESLQGEVANAIVTNAYNDIFVKKFNSPRFMRLAQKGARPQGFLLASTGSKADKFTEDVRSKYPPDVYVTPVQGPDVVNTLPIGTIRYLQQSKVEATPSIILNAQAAKLVLSQANEAGIQFDTIGAQIFTEGMKKFMEDFQDVQNTTAGLVTEEKARAAAVEEILSAEPYSLIIGTVKPELRGAIGTVLAYLKSQGIAATLGTDKLVRGRYAQAKIVAFPPSKAPVIIKVYTPSPDRKDYGVAVEYTNSTLTARPGLIAETARPSELAAAVESKISVIRDALNSAGSLSGEVLMRAAPEAIAESAIREEAMLAPLREAVIKDLGPEKGPQLFDRYVREDALAFLQTISDMVQNKAESVDPVQILLVCDTGLDRGTNDTVIWAEKYLKEQFGDSILTARGTGARLIADAEKEYGQLLQANTKKGKKIAVVSFVSNDTLKSDAEGKLLSMVKDTNALMERAQGHKPISALLNVENEFEGKDLDISIFGLYSAGLRLAYNLGDESMLLAALNSIAVNANNGQHFTSDDLKKLLLTGILKLRPIRAVDPEEIREAHAARTAAMRSL